MKPRIDKCATLYFVMWINNKLDLNLNLTLQRFANKILTKNRRTQIPGSPWLENHRLQQQKRVGTLFRF